MNTKTIKQHLSQREFIRCYLIIWKGALDITGKELDILTEFLVKYFELIPKINDKGILYKLLFSPDIKKEVQQATGITDDNFYTYLSRLKKKNIIIKDDKGILRFNDYIIPVNNLNFEFIVK